MKAEMKRDYKIHMNYIKTFMVLVGVFATGHSFSQSIENDFQTRTEAKISYSPLDKLSLSFNPEIRWNESFQVSKYMLESSISYEPIKNLVVGGGYRFIVNPRTDNSTDYLHRFAFYTSYKKKIARFEPSLRVKYTNYTEDKSTGEFLRYKAKVEYDIKACHFTPYAGVEPFHDINENQFYKVRYSTGVAYKLDKHSRLKLGYSLDYYLQDYRNKHIFKLGYQYKF